MPIPLMHQISAALDDEPVSVEPLSGGSVSTVFGVSFEDGRKIVAKVDNSGGKQLEVEAYMLRYLADHSQLPVPEVFYSDGDLLLLELLPGRSSFSSLAQEHAAELLAQLHSITAPLFGFERPTLIGGLHQPNPWTENWLDFFREQRLRYMAREALVSGRISSAVFDRLDCFCERLGDWISSPVRPALIHGDAWTGNILASPTGITGFLDPAVYFADSEIELAFTTLFGTFGQAFFRRYDEIRPIRPGFMEVRRDIYNLYPLLVHVRLFGGSYVGAVQQTLDQFGC
jgi:fructosamine-3-kinase